MKKSGDLKTVLTWPLAGVGIALGLFVTADGAEPGSGGKTIEVTANVTQVLEKNLLGFGVEWEYEGDRPQWNVENPVWKKHWPEVCKRVAFMKPGVARVMHDARMYGRLEGGTFVRNMDSPETRALYQVLDVTRQSGIQVVLGEWWMPPDLAAAFGGITSPRWAEEVIVPFLTDLRERRGYRHIRWFNLLNEPGASHSFEDWRKAILNLHAALRKAGLDKEISLVGTDGPGDWNDWVARTAGDPDLRDALGAYEYHLYAHLRSDRWSPSLLEGLLEGGELRAKRELVNRLDSRGPSKPFFMGEAGIDDGNKGDNQTNRGSFEYGVWMADYAAQSLRAGQAGLIAWCLDDAMHFGGSHGKLGLKGWGFWNSLAGTEGYPEAEFTPRPAFYAWSLVCRLFPAGSSSVNVSDSGDPALRVAAVVPPGGGLSLMLVNEAPEPRRVRVKVPGMLKLEMSGYVYQRDGRDVDEDGMPRRRESLVITDPSLGIEAEVPGPGVVFFTTLRNAP